MVDRAVIDRAYSFERSRRERRVRNCRRGL